MRVGVKREKGDMAKAEGVGFTLLRGVEEEEGGRHRPNLEGTHPSPPPRAGVTGGGTCCQGGRPLLS